MTTINATNTNTSLPPTTFPPPLVGGGNRRQSRFEPIQNMQQAQQQVQRVQQQNKNWHQHQRQPVQRQPVQSQPVHSQPVHSQPVQRQPAQHNEFDAYQPTLFVSPISRDIGVDHLYDYFNNRSFGHVKDIIIKPGQHQDFAVIAFYDWNVRETVELRRDLQQGRFAKMKYFHSPTNFETWKIAEYKSPSERKSHVTGSANIRGPPAKQYLQTLAAPKKEETVQVQEKVQLPVPSTDSEQTDFFCVEEDNVSTPTSIDEVDECERPEKLDYGEVLPSKPRRKIIINPFASKNKQNSSA